MAESGADRGLPLAGEYFEHGADIGVIGRGQSLEAAFESAAAATFAIQCDPASVRQELSVDLAFEERDPEFALVLWLNALLEAARSEHAALSRFSLRRNADRWIGRAWGERWNPGHERGIEVKGATLTALSVRKLQRDGRTWWEARCVVDV